MDKETASHDSDDPKLTRAIAGNGRTTESLSR